MNRRGVVRGVGVGVLAADVIAAGFCVFAAVLGVQIAVESNVIEGIAVVVVALILLSGIGWRFRVHWQRLRSS